MNVIPSAVAALICVEQDILLVQRAEHLRAFPGYWACPGGKIETDEATLAPRAAYCGHDLLHLSALRRELQEELAVDIDEHACEISFLGTASTPPGQPRRYETFFYRIDLATRPQLKLEAAELADARWAPAAQWWQQYCAGDLLCVSAAQRMLETLAGEPDARQVPTLGARPGQDCGLNLSEPLDGLRLLPLRSHTLPPATHTNAFLLGDAGTPQILVDPSPADDQEYQRLLQFLQTREPLSAIFLTHHHPDHHEQANRLARELSLPIWLSADTQQRIKQRFSPDHLKGIETRNIADGDPLCHWHTEPVRAIAVPGHDAGHLALAPASLRWMIVGDLYQGVGTVVIGKPEGNMAEYFSSLRKVIQLNPGLTVPSHGIALPGTRQIRLTLEHREARERRVLELHQQGLDLDQIVASEYAQVPKALWPLARMNVEGHLEKLQAEGLVNI